MDDLKEISNSLSLIMIELRQINFFLERIGDAILSKNYDEDKK